MHRLFKHGFSNARQPVRYCDKWKMLILLFSIEILNVFNRIDILFNILNCFINYET